MGEKSILRKKNIFFSTFFHLKKSFLISILLQKNKTHIEQMHEYIYAIMDIDAIIILYDNTKKTKITKIKIIHIEKLQLQLSNINYIIK